MARQKDENGKATAVNARKEEIKPVAFQVRFDPDLHQELHKVAEEAGISLNQLIQGICRGALGHVYQGEAFVSPSGFMRVKPQRGCLFFGQPGDSWTEDEEIDYHETGEMPKGKDRGRVWFGLDFTNRGVVTYRQR